MARSSLLSDGFIDLLDRLEKSADSVERRAARSLNEEFKRQMAGTTIGPTGRLHASLTTDNSDHIFSIDIRGRIRIGSRDPASRYTRRGSNSIPALVPQPYFDIIANMLFRPLNSGGKTRAR